MDIKIKNKKHYQGEGEYIGRPSPLGNPFKVTNNQSRDKAIEMYSDWLIDAIMDEGQASIDRPEIISELDRLFSILINNKSLTLICWCSPKSCHGDIIKQALLNKYYCGTYLKENKL